AGWRRPLASHLELLSGIAIKAVGVYRRDVTSIALGHPLTLRLGQACPGGTDRQPRHRSDVEAAANDRLQLRETTAMTQYPAVFHRTEQRVIKTLHCIAAARGRGMKRIPTHTEAEASGKGRSHTKWPLWDTGLANLLIEDRWKRTHRHVSYPRSAAELIRHSRSMGIWPDLVHWTR